MQTLKPHCFVFFVAAVSVVAVAATGRRTAADDRSPNVLIAISDDQSWPHASAYGSKMVKTPNFDRVAREGVLFTNAFSPSPGCSPSRASFLTGLHTWQLEHAGTHASYFDQRFATFPDQLTRGGYYVGYTGKGWGPGNWRKLGRQTNPAGPVFQPASQDDKRMGRYAGAFANFLRQRPADKPFCFWFGSSDPHRGYAKASGLQKGKRLADAEVPAFLPDTPEIRGDMLDYAFEVERFDDDLGKILKLLEQTGELDNTLVIVTSDNGIPIPRAKANCYEWGIHMPLAIRWGQARAGRTVDDLVGFVDLTATIYDATGVDRPAGVKLVGRGIANLLTSSKSGIVDPRRDAVYSARERHSSSRYNSLSYPQRCIRT
ncbi:MAG: sulfatase, partial [Pirellulaceae bacterium]|nr:sulfatase [Pirellulaceae bacterium]